MTLNQGPGITLSAADVDAVVAGHFKPPEIDPLQLAPDAALPQSRLESNYRQVQASLDAEFVLPDVYLLSRRFLEWATIERLSGDFVTASLTSGASAADELALARHQIQLEYEDLAAWLRLKGVKDLGPEPSSILVELIRSGTYPRLGLSVRLKQVEFTRRVESTGRTEVPVHYLDRLRPKGKPGARPGHDIKEKRPALAIVWSGPASSQESLSSHLGGDFRLSPPAISDLPKLLPTQTAPRIRRLLGDTAQYGLLEIDGSAERRRMARAAIGLRKEDIESATDSRGRTIDLRSSDFGEIVTAFLSQLAVGNGKSCELDDLKLDRSNGRLEAAFTLHHRQSWPSLRDAQSQLRRVLGPVGTDVEDLADHLPDVAFDLARKLYHEADKNAHEAGKQAYEAEQRAHEAADRVATKGQELATLAAELNARSG